MAEQNPWDIEAQSVPVQTRPSRNPWEVESSQAPETVAAPAPVKPVANPWEVEELEVARLEETTLFGRGKAQTVFGEVGAGLQSGARQVAATPYALAALGIEGFDYITGQDHAEAANAWMQDAVGISTGGAQRGIASVEDLTANPMTWLKYAAGVTGEAVPFLASLMAGGGAAPLLAKLMARKGIDGATRATILASMPAQVAGAVATGTAIETGATAQELYQATGEIKPGASVLAGSAKGALEAVFPMMLSRQLGLTGGQAVELMERLFTRQGAKQLGRGVVTEGLTEWGQEEIDLTTRAYLDENFQFLSPEANSRRLNALVAGATGGGFIQAGLQAMAGRVSDGTPVLPQDAQRAVEDVPFIMGQGVNELAVSGPEDILRTAPVGGPTTVTAANIMEQQQLLNENPLHSRGLYAPVVEGREPSFGSQDEAISDGRILGGRGYLRLDPGKVQRGDITVAVQDLPDSAADSRIDYLDKETANDAQGFLVQAIKLKTQAAKQRSGERREATLALAQNAYREALNRGARVEPLADSQVMLRDPKKTLEVVESMDKLATSASQAGLKETRKLSTGKKFFVFEKGVEEAPKGLGGRPIDLEKVDPDMVTGLPDKNFVRRLLATHEVSRKLSIGRARALGIRFTGLAKSNVVRQQALLRQLTRIAQGLAAGKAFTSQPSPIVDRFMKLVDFGLRLDVHPESDTFAVLEQQGMGAFVPDNNMLDGSVRMDEGLSRITRQRAKRGRASRVSPYLQYENGDVANAFFSQFHNNEFQRILAGDVKVGPAEVQVPGSPASEYVPGRSPLAVLIRNVAKQLNLKTDYVIEIVGPNTLGADVGVAYVEKTIQLPNGKNSEARSVIQINPWYYARQTNGEKPLTKPAGKYVIAAGPVLMFAGNGPKDMGRRVVYKGQETTLGAALKDNPLKAGQYPLLVFNADISSPGVYAGNMGLNDVEARFPDAKPINNPMSDDVVQYRNYPDAPVPAYTPIASRAGEAAAALGVPVGKLYADDRLTEMYSDVAVAFAETLVKHEWAQTDAALQEELKDAWRRSMHLAKGTALDSQMAKVLPHPLVDRVLSGKRTRKSNQFEFEEWLVSQTARYFTESPKGLIGPVAKWLNKAGKMLVRAFKAIWEGGNQQVKPYSLDPAAGAPHEIVQKWLDNLSLRGLTGSPPVPFLEDATRDALMDSMIKNQKRFAALGLDDYVIATPERATGRQVRELIKWLPKTAAKDKAKLQALIGVSDRHSTMMDWLLGIHQLADLNPHIAGLRDYVSRTRVMENSAASWATMADGRLRQAQALGKAQTDALFELMNDLDQLAYLDQEKLAKKEIKARWPTQQELLALVKKHGLNREAFDVYVEMRNDFLQFLSYLEQVSVQRAQETITDPHELAQKVLEIQGETAQLKARPYFPHMRFGKLTLVAKGLKGQTLHFEAFQDKAARDAGAKVLETRYSAQLKTGEVRIVEDEMSDVAQQYQGLPAYALQNVIKSLGLNQDPTLLSPAQKKDLSMLESMAIKAAPTESLRKHMAWRKNVPGWSMDGMRAYANYFGRAARFMARMEHGSRLEQAIQDVRDSGGSLTRDKRTSISDFMQQHYEAAMQPAADWAELRAAGFLWYFAFAPASALVNLMQVPMVSIPFLASKFGDMKTMGKVVGAYAQASKEFFSWLRGTSPVEDTIKQEALEEAHFSRLLDDGYAAELSAISQGPVLQASIAASKGARAIRRFAQWGTLPFQLAERMNRSVTFRATYDLALRDNTNPWIDEVMLANKPEADQLRIDRGWDENHIRAYMAAADALRKSQFEYGRWSRPKLMEGPRGVLLMFKTYLQNMLYFMFKVDRGTQVRFMLMLLFIAGAMGMPGAEDATELAQWLAKLFGVRFDFEETARKLIVDFGVSDSVAPDLLLHGASRYGFGIGPAMNGLGIPAPTVDLSGSLSMGRIIPGLQPLMNPGRAGGNDAVGEVVSEIAGPVFGVPFAMYQSLIDHQLPANDPKRWERAMPRALQAMSKASRYLAEERERDRLGSTVMKFDPNDLNDQLDILLGTGLGFQPTRLRQTWDYIRAQKEAQDYWRGQRQVLMGELYRAHRLKDKEGKRDAIEAIKRFNEEAPDKSLRISGESMRQSMQARAKANRMKENKVPREKYLRGVSKSVDALYPEAGVGHGSSKVVHRRVLPRGSGPVPSEE